MPTVQSFMEIGQRIKGLRGKQNRSQFAEAFLVAPSTLARWETGESQPDLGFLVRLSGAFGVSIEWLVTGNDEFPINGFGMADNTLGFLDKIDWCQAMKNKTLSDASGDAKMGAGRPKKQAVKKQLAENASLIENKMGDSRPIGQEAAALQGDINALNKELRDLLRQNGDLRVEVEVLRAKVRDLERELREALTPGERQPPVAGAG